VSFGLTTLVSLGWHRIATDRKKLGRAAEEML